SLTGVRVPTGVLLVRTGGGADTVTMEGDSFFRWISIDQGAGDDVLRIATVGDGSAARLPAPRRIVYVYQGAGNDTLTIGSGPGIGPEFSGGGARFDGGPGYDTSNESLHGFGGDAQFVNYENPNGP